MTNAEPLVTATAAAHEEIAKRALFDLAMFRLTLGYSRSLNCCLLGAWARANLATLRSRDVRYIPLAEILWTSCSR